MRKRVQLPAFLPDQSVNSGVLLEARNVIPAVDGYSPFPSFVSLSPALGDEFKGGASFIATDGTAYLLAGTTTGLETFDGSSWSDLETGMTVTAQWRFVQFGDYVIAVNGVQTKVVDLSAGTSGNLAGAPNGKSIAVVGDYVVIGQDTNDLLEVTTSAFNDHTGWTPGTNGSTVQPMLAGGEVMGLAGGEYGVILQRQRLVRMTRTGDAIAPFQYDEITPNVGCASRASVVQVGRTVFFLSDRGFMALEDGQAIRPIGSEKIDRTFQDSVGRDDYERLFATVDPQNKLVFWAIPGTPGTIWIYNFELDRWSTVETTFQGVFAGFTTSTTLEAVSATYPDLDAMPYSLDAARFAGGNPRVYGVVAGEIGTFSGGNLAARFGLGFAEYAGGRVARVRSIRPISDAIEGNSVSLDVRARLGDGENWRNASSMRASGNMPIRASGRFIRTRWEIAAETLWTYAQGLELELEAGGER